MSDDDLPEIDAEALAGILNLAIEYPDTCGVPALLTVASTVGHYYMADAHPVLHAGQDVVALGIGAGLSYVISSTVSGDAEDRNKVWGLILVAGLFAASYFGPDFVGKWFGHDEKQKTEQKGSLPKTDSAAAKPKPGW
jgi:hypothetical protein